MSIEEIKALRNQIADRWKWSKCYELLYVNTRTGREFLEKHWALTGPDGKGPVCSLGLISNDCSSNATDFRREPEVVFVENAPEMIDFLLAEIERLSTK